MFKHLYLFFSYEVADRCHSVYWCIVLVQMPATSPHIWSLLFAPCLVIRLKIECRIAGLLSDLLADIQQ
jgi:hypothetical protein